MLPIRTILFATDFSPPAEYGFQLACALARDYGAHLTVAHVKTFPTAVYGEFGALPPGPEDTDEALQAKLTSLKPPSSDITVSYVLAEGDPAAEIIRLAKDTPCDLIVLGTHGRTGLSRLLMGSIAEQVVRKAH